jgi:hypothetical protein
MSRAAVSICIYPTADEEPPPLVEEPTPPLREEPEEDDAEGDSEVAEPPPPVEAPKPPLVEEPAEENSDREYGAYILNMARKWAGSDYESSEDEYAYGTSFRGHYKM